VLRLLITGGRTYTDYSAAASALDAIHAKTPIALLIHGAARGADSTAAQWAKNRNVPQAPFPADWEKHGKAAGPIRNQQMIDEGRPDAFHQFPGGNGTADMAKRCKRASIPEV
jgi:YspA, cpYpsA-related SLOG family